MSWDSISSLQILPFSADPDLRASLWHYTRRLRDIDKLSKRDRDALARTIDAFLTRAKPE